MEERRRECFLLWASLVVSKPVVTLWLRWKHHTDERKIRNISEVPWGFFDARCPFWGSFSIATFSFSCLSCPVCGQQQKVRERHKKPFYKENSSDNLCSNFWEKCRTSIGKPVKRYFESSSSESHWNRDCHNKISSAVVQCPLFSPLFCTKLHLLAHPVNSFPLLYHLLFSRKVKDCSW